MWDDEPTTAEQQAAMARALRGQQEMGILGQMSGDKVLSQVGTGMIRGAEQEKAARLQKALAAQAAKEQRAFQAEQHAMDRDVRRDEMRQRGLDRALQRDIMFGEKQEKKDLKASLLNAPGYSRDGNIGIRDVEASEFREGIAASKDMLNSVDTLGAMKDANGVEILPTWLGGDKAPMEAEKSRQLLALKAMAKTGVLDAQTERVAATLIPEPSDSASTARAKSDAMKRLVNERLSAKAGSMGYVPDAPRQQMGGQPFPAAGGGFDDSKRARLQELRAKRAAGQLK
jgi:hypothetical protein